MQHVYIQINILIKKQLDQKFFGRLPYNLKKYGVFKKPTEKKIKQSDI